MGISSLGVGSNILTQDVLDQLRKADEAQRITPLTLNIANENDKSAARDVLDAAMVNFRDAANELQSTTLFDTRKADVSGSSVAMTANNGSDIQKFTLDVTQLATKEIDESDSFGSNTDKIATDSGSMTIDIKNAAGDVTSSYDIDYTADMTLDDLKKAINKKAGDDIQASVVQVASGDYRLFLNATKEGEDQNFSITDNDGNLSDDNGSSDGGTNLTDNLSTIQDGVNAKFTYDGQDVERSSNEVNDLVTGYNITLKETGKSTVNVSQDREDLENRVDSFVKQYNAVVGKLSEQTKSSVDSKERGIFSNDSIVKAMQSSIKNMLGSISNAGGNLQDYGFDIDKSGVMSVDKTVLNAKIDENPKNVKAFFAGGDYTDSSNNVTTLTGAFSSIYTTVNSFTKTNGDLDEVKNSISENLKNYEDRKTSATERLDAKYAIMKKQYAAYNLMINNFTSASSVFTQLDANQNNN